MRPRLKLIPWIMVYVFVSTGHSSQQTKASTDPLRAAVEMAFRARHGVDFDHLEGLGDPERVRGVLLDMLTAYRNPKDDMDRKFLYCTILAVGHLKERRALVPLTNLAQDSALKDPLAWLREDAVKSLGKIDVIASRDVLYSVFEHAEPEQWLLRIAVVEALSEANDSAILAKIEYYTRGELRPHARKKMEAAIQRMKARIQKP
jgi:HEAT repeat protein